MRTIELYINNQSVDFGDEVKIQLDKVVSEYRDPLKKTGAYSLELTLPYTQKNRAIFNGEDDRQLLGKFRTPYPAKLIVNNQLLIDGQFLHLNNSARGFEGAIGNAKVGNPKLGDVLLNKKLTDIKSFEPVDFDGAQTVADSWSSVVAYPDAEVCYPWVSRSFYDYRRGFTTTYEDLGMSHFVAAIMKNIFTDAGYELDGDIFSNATFQKLVLLYSSKAKQAWNYGKIARMTSENPGGLFGVNMVNASQPKVRQNDVVYRLSYPWQIITGDESKSLGSDGVYTAKYSGLYTIRIRADHQALRTSGQVISSTGFTAFRCITDNEEIPESMLPSSSSFASVTLASLDDGTLAVGGNTTITFTARLVEGKQYTVQRYVSVPLASYQSGSINFIAPDAGGFSIDSVDAPVVVNPALFLPDMSQTDFVNAIFKIFNLYYQLNADAQTITLFTRDEFFQETIQDLVDLTPYLNLSTMEETPLTSTEIGKTYLTYAGDDSDYLLKQTDYLERVNGLQPDESTKLPFAPLGFMRVTATIYNTDQSATLTGDDMIPAILPAQDSEDSSVLNDVENFTDSGSWVPRLCLYHGTNWIKPDITVPLLSLTYHRVFLDGLGYNGYIQPPRLTFFDVASQPAYRITENTSLRSFGVELATGTTIFDNGGNTSFLADTSRIPEVNLTSLATNVSSSVNPRGFFYQLYSNDLLIGSLSNYIEGTGRMNANLFTQLNGRQVLRLDSDLFLLESIKNYDVTKELATFKLYKFVANTNTTTSISTRYTSTKTVTVSCQSGYTGSPATATETRTSYVSQQAADDAATAAATASATLLLVCTPPPAPEWTSTQTYTAYCPSGYTGAPSDGYATYTSQISQADADVQALILAQSDAESRLSCQYDDGSV